jgi:hypothetical protein
VSLAEMTGFQNMILLGRGHSKPIQASSMWYHQSWQRKTKKYPDDEETEKLMIEKIYKRVPGTIQFVAWRE